MPSKPAFGLSQSLEPQIKKKMVVLDLYIQTYNNLPDSHLFDTHFFK